MALEEKSEKTLNLDELKEELELAHEPVGWLKAKSWFDTHLGNDVTSRIKVLASILWSESVFTFDQKLKDVKIEEFHCLQGDVISSSVVSVPEPISPYNPGDTYYYVLVPASCSANRYKFVLTARLIPVSADNKDQATMLKNTLLFQTHKYFYLPPLEEQDESIIGNLAHFEEISYIAKNDLKHARRVSCLSEMGWRLFNAFLTYHFTRPSPDEVIIRKSSNQSEITVEVSK